MKSEFDKEICILSLTGSRQESSAGPTSLSALLDECLIEIDRSTWWSFRSFSWEKNLWGTPKRSTWKALNVTSILAGKDLGRICDGGTCFGTFFMQGYMYLASNVYEDEYDSHNEHTIELTNDHIRNNNDNSDDINKIPSIYSTHMANHRYIGIPCVRPMRCAFLVRFCSLLDVRKDCQILRCKQEDCEKRAFIRRRQPNSFVIYINRRQVGLLCSLWFGSKNGSPFFVDYGILWSIFFPVFFPFCLFFSSLAERHQDTNLFGKINRRRGDTHVFMWCPWCPCHILSRCHGRVSFPTTLDLSLCLVGFESISPTPSPQSSHIFELCYWGRWIPPEDIAKFGEENHGGFNFDNEKWCFFWFKGLLLVLMFHRTVRRFEVWITCCMLFVYITTWGAMRLREHGM